MTKGGKHMGPGAKGKGDGTGAMTTGDRTKIPPNIVLSNRDKSRHSGERGQDSKYIQTEQMQDHQANRLPKGD
jgi:hypothetical protein